MPSRLQIRLLTAALTGTSIFISQVSWGAESNSTLNSELPRYLEQARHTFNVPGLAVSIVKDGRVVFEQGFGERSLESHGAVSAHTLFCIASNTKSFTGTALEILAYAKLVALEATQLARAMQKEATHPAEAPPSKPLPSYVGIYRDAWYGDIEVSLDRTSLRMRFTKSPRLQGTLHPLGSNTFLARWDDRLLDADALIQFTVDQSGRIKGAGMRRASPETPGAYDYQDLHLVRIK